MPKEIPRARRIAEQVQRTLAELLLREVRDPRLKPMTITHVKVSPDLSHVWVMYTLLSGDSHDALQREILDEAARYLRGPLGRSLRLRLAPELHFAPDEELEQGNRLNELITRAVREDRKKGGGATGSDGADDDAHYDSAADDDAADDDAQGDPRP
jgi:ribosome-binding factor A